jgi:hypothetical protein
MLCFVVFVMLCLSPDVVMSDGPLLQPSNKVRDLTVSIFSSFKLLIELCPRSRPEDLLNVVSAVFIGGLKVMQLLLKVADICFQFLCLGGQTLVDYGDRCGHKPGNKNHIV